MGGGTPTANRNGSTGNANPLMDFTAMGVANYGAGPQQQTAGTIQNDNALKYSAFPRLLDLHDGSGRHRRKRPALPIPTRIAGWHGLDDGRIGPIHVLLAAAR